MTDRELLELAAKAAGYKFEWRETAEVGGFCLLDEPGLHFWNPLTDDGDALRLAVKLLLTVQQRDDHVKVGWSGCAQWIGEEWVACDSWVRGNATRRCIVRAAAEIGRTL